MRLLLNEERDGLRPAGSCFSSTIGMDGGMVIFAIVEASLWSRADGLLDSC
jgi:hypothetical protein